MAGAALDAIETLAQRPGQPGFRPSAAPDWPLFQALAPLLEALVALAAAEPLAQRRRQLSDPPATP